MVRGATFCPWRAGTVAPRWEEVPNPDVVIPYSRSSRASACILRDNTGKRIGWLEGKQVRMACPRRPSGDVSYRRREGFLILKPRFQKLGDGGAGAQGYVLGHIAAVQTINAKGDNMFVGISCQSPSCQGQESNRDGSCAYKHGQLVIQPDKNNFGSHGSFFQAALASPSSSSYTTEHPPAHEPCVLEESGRNLVADSVGVIWLARVSRSDS